MALYQLARPWLFGLNPETAHNLTIGSLSRAGRLAGAVACRPPPCPVTLMGMELPNPVGLAAGLDKDGDAIDGLAALGFGFLELGTVTPKPQPGNPKPRMFRVAREQVLVNRMGFNNKGVDHLVDRIRSARFTGVMGVNIGKNKDTPNDRAVDDYLTCLRKAYSVASYITVNVSSPNTAGLRDLQAGDAMYSLLSDLKTESQKLAKQHGRTIPMAVKVAPDQTPDSLEALTHAINRAAPDGVIATNTTIDKSSLGDNPIAQEAGGLSGAPLLGAANQTLTDLRAQLNDRIELIGVGGITRGEDAASKLECGASAVQIYSGLIFRGPNLVGEAGRAAQRYLQRQS
ncbi:MAG: quinone-dependent dihydroorotate dehydrogenase [Lysobacterales bacterium]